jgi:hypothetical protein
VDPNLDPEEGNDTKNKNNKNFMFSLEDMRLVLELGSSSWRSVISQPPQNVKERKELVTNLISRDPDLVRSKQSDYTNFCKG